MQGSMKVIYRLVVLSAMILGLACRASAPPADSSSKAGDLQGDRFRCDDPGWVNICLRVLRDDCSLSIFPGRGLPREPQDKLVLINGLQARIVTGPADLAGCVEIKSAEDALEYLRFFSSRSIVHLFSEQALEVYRGSCFAVCLSSVRWQALGLGGPYLVANGGGYDITRYVIKPLAGISEVRLYSVTQRVEANGVVVDVESQLVPLQLEDSLLLSFPRFM